MSNTWFSFRQFTLQQERCAMKVTTDACIQGAWTPLPLRNARALDIGAGTGLLSLMMAQRAPGLTIDAVEYDPGAAQQAAENVAVSPWAGRINVLHADVRQYEATAQYDVIICNPPFFSASLLGPQHSRNMARHDVSLTRHELLARVTGLLKHDGCFSLLLPYTEYMLWLPLAGEHGLHERESLHISHRPGAAVKRVVSILGQTAMPCTAQQLCIKGNDGNYTEDFNRLLGPFYLPQLQRRIT